MPSLLNRPILWKPHPGPQSEFHSRLEDEVLFGGSKGPGKTDCLISEALRQTDNPNYHGIILRRTFPQLKEVLDRVHVLYPQLKAVWNGDDKRYTFPNRSKITFGSCKDEKSKEDYQGKQFQFIGFDQLEQFTESQYNFISAQCRTADSSLKCYVRSTGNPGGVGHRWIKRRFIDNRIPGKTYKREYTLPNGEVITRTSCFIKATIYDNPTLLKADPTYLANLMSLPEAERKAYLEGDWNAFTSLCVFDKNGMRIQESRIKDPLYIGKLQETQANYRVIESSDGMLKIWKMPNSRLQYEIGVDVAEGDEEGDYSSIHVLDKSNFEFVAHWHGHINPLDLAKVAMDIGFFYNTAEICVELPGPGISTINKLVEQDYPALYNYDKSKPGWRNDTASRHNMLTYFMGAIQDGSVTIQDRDTLDEMYNLIRHERTRRIQAMEQCHDDRVMSAGIALWCNSVNPFYEQPHNLRLRREPAVVSSRVAGGGFVRG